MRAFHHPGRIAAQCLARLALDRVEHCTSTATCGQRWSGAGYPIEVQTFALDQASGPGTRVASWAMIPLLRMLEYKNLSLRDAEAAGFHQLADAAKRCLRCPDTAACVRWLKWRGTYGRAPSCLNAGYFDWLKQSLRPD